MPTLDVLGLVLGLVYLLLPLFVLGAHQRVRRLEQRTEERLRSLEARASAIEASISRTPAFEGTRAEAAEPSASLGAFDHELAQAAQSTSLPSRAPPTEDAWAAGLASPRPPAESELYRRAKAWLLGGNTVARTGVVVLFFGVAFFLKYAAEHGWLPVELRLAAAALGGTALTALGWKLRERRLAYGLALQGGGIGVIYLTVYAAMGIYGLLPPTAGLALLACLAALGAALAVLQDARSLAVLAAAGGFLAPLLVPRSGSHVVLFAYYAVLDVGILGIAWFKAWRELNVLGFVCTFVIGAFWGYQFYQPAYFWSTEPFLLLFFLIYVAVPVLFASRQPPDLRGYVDGPLVFGVPLAAFGLQAALMRDTEYGLGLGAVVVGVSYAALAMALWRRPHARRLAEAFIALAVVFGTVAIPLAVDGRWTTAAWAVEGAALVWLGLRQGSVLARRAGLALQVGAAIAFLAAHGSSVGARPILNSFYLGGLMVSAAGAVSAFQLRNADVAPTRAAGGVSPPALVLWWSLVWWLGAGTHEIVAHAAHGRQADALLLLVAGTAAVAGSLRQRLPWADLRYPPLLLLPTMVVIALLRYGESSGAHLLAGWGPASWSIAWTVHVWSLYRLEEEWPSRLVGYWHHTGLWLAAFIAAWEAWWIVGRWLPEGLTWRYAAPALVVTSILHVLPRLVSRPVWPFARHGGAYGTYGQLPLAMGLALWTLHASFQLGNPAPLAYVPLLNPLELTQALALAALAGGRWDEARAGGQRWFGRGAAALGFVALNGLIARAFHAFGGVSFDFDALWASPAYQATASIVWTGLALALMVAAPRVQRRGPWVFGAALLGAVVAKLFLVDLSGLGTVARILSFLVVGLLMLLIGYLAPLPPRPAVEDAR